MKPALTISGEMITALARRVGLDIHAVLDDVRKQIPWELKISPQLTVTERPTDAEIDFVRRFAPAESLGREAATELAIAHALERAEARGKNSK